AETRKERPQRHPRAEGREVPGRAAAERLAPRPRAETEVARPRPRPALKEARPGPRPAVESEQLRPVRPRAKARARDADDKHPRPVRRAQRGSPVLLIVGLLVGFFVVTGGGVGGYFVYRAYKGGGTAKGDTPEPQPVQPTRIELEDSAVGVGSIQAAGANP